MVRNAFTYDSACSRSGMQWAAEEGTDGQDPAGSRPHQNVLLPATEAAAQEPQMAITAGTDEGEAAEGDAAPRRPSLTPQKRAFYTYVFLMTQQIPQLYDVHILRMTA